MAKRIKVWDGTNWQDVGVLAATPGDYVSTTALSAALLSYKQEVNLAISADTTLVAGRRYFVDTTAARTLTLPASPTLGQEILIFDATGTAATNNVTINSNSGKINGSVQDLVLDSDGAIITLTYTGSTYGWGIK